MLCSPSQLGCPLSLEEDPDDCSTPDLAILFLQIKQVYDEPQTPLQLTALAVAIALTDIYGEV